MVHAKAFVASVRPFPFLVSVFRFPHPFAFSKRIGGLIVLHLVIRVIESPSAVLDRMSLVSRLVCRFLSGLLVVAAAVMVIVFSFACSKTVELMVVVLVVEAVLNMWLVAVAVMI